MISRLWNPKGLFIFGSLPRPGYKSRITRFRNGRSDMPGHQPFLSTAPLKTNVDSAPRSPNAGLSNFSWTIKPNSLP